MYCLLQKYITKKSHLIRKLKLHNIKTYNVTTKLSSYILTACTIIVVEKLGYEQRHLNKEN